MPKFSVGQPVLVVNNPPTPDPRVPDQLNGRALGRGEYKLKPDPGEILAVMEQEQYMVLVELVQEYEKPNGKKGQIVSHRKRVIPEAKLRAVS